MLQIANDVLMVTDYREMRRKYSQVSCQSINSAVKRISATRTGAQFLDCALCTDYFMRCKNCCPESREVCFDFSIYF